MESFASEAQITHLGNPIHGELYFESANHTPWEDNFVPSLCPREDNFVPHEELCFIRANHTPRESHPMECYASEALRESHPMEFKSVAGIPPHGVQSITRRGNPTPWSAIKSHAVGTANHTPREGNFVSSLYFSFFLSQPVPHEDNFVLSL
ncbi:hypothetical protein AMTR_s00041p00227180 [Amborella trichopoda]|uniref:Uncharacterized protein n=1 Tax=Amborella trichopoda TaxID=13333 RepID=W1PZM3_AMBTC|nr:hypothetical protein AMTR_s00041p00227180 [Amborella trichopoda]